MDSNYLRLHDGRSVAATHQGTADMRGDGVPAIADYWSAIKKRIRAIALFIGAGTCAAYLISTRITPVYEAAATVELDRDKPSGIVGDQATRASYSPDDDLYMATQIKLVQVDSVIRPVAHQFGLLVRKERNNASEAPIELEAMKVGRVPNTHLLQIRYKSTDSALAAAVVNGICERYLENYYANRLRSMGTISRYAQQQLDELKTRMERSNRALAQYERELNLVNPEQKTTLAADRVLQFNAEYTKAQAERIRREAELNLARTQTLDSAQASSLSEPLHKLIERRNEAQEKFSQIKEHYGSEHPEYRRGAAQIAELDRQVDAMRQSISRRHSALYEEAADLERMVDASLKTAKLEADRLNQKAFGYERLKNEAESDRKLYEQLAQRVKEADINSAFRNDAIRIVDRARAPVNPVFPNLTMNLLLAFVLCAGTGTAAAVAADKMKTTVANAAEARACFGVKVIGALPLVRRRSGLTAERSSTLGLIGGSAEIAQFIDSAQPAASKAYVESARSIRNSLALRRDWSRMRTVLITSALPGEGKTTTAIHLAVLNAIRGQRTLLVDGDFRRPSIHRALDVPNSCGLADFINGSGEWKTGLFRAPGIGFLDILPAGTPNATTIDLAADRLLAMLEAAATEYDMVIVDAPPVLGCSEAVPLAVAADGVLVVVEAQSTRRAQVRAALDMLYAERANVLGLALNKVPRGECAAADYYYHAETAGAAQ